MPPANIDMSLIQEAMERRRSGDIRVPPTGQTTLPGAPTPGGGPNVPMQGVPTPPTGQTQSPAARGAINGGLQAGQALKQNPNVDDETKQIAKILVTKLLKLM